MRLITGNAHPDLAQKVAALLKRDLLQANVQRFNDGEVWVEVLESVRGEDVYIIQPTCFPVNETLTELLIMIDALRRGSAGQITAVIPYFGYARQDRKTGPRTPIAAKLVANLLAVAGVDRMLTLDLHAGQIQGFFDIPTDNLTVAPLFIKDIAAHFDLKKILIVSPDVGGVVRARTIADYFGGEIAIVDKRRLRPGESKVMHIIGDVAGRDCILVDDLADSAGTMCNAADALLKAGALSVHAYVAHPVLSNGAADRVQNSALASLVCTNTIPLPDAKKRPKIRVLDIAPLLAEAIAREHDHRSISSLFNWDLPEKYHIESASSPKRMD